jgi:hypothetical protein
VSEFLVEVYVSRVVAATAKPTCEEVSTAAQALTREGRRVQLVQSIFVPEDDTCFYLFEAESGDHAREAATRSGLQVERVVEAVSEPMGAR